MFVVLSVYLSFVLFIMASIDHFGVDVTVNVICSCVRRKTLVTSAWKWVKFAEIRGENALAFGCQNWNTNPFYRILSSKRPFEAKRRCLNGQTNE